MATEDAAPPPGEEGTASVGSLIYAQPFGAMWPESGPEPWHRGKVVGETDTHFEVDFIDLEFSLLYIRKDAGASHRIRLRDDDPEPPKREAPRPELRKRLSQLTSSSAPPMATEGDDVKQDPDDVKDDGLAEAVAGLGISGVRASILDTWDKSGPQPVFPEGHPQAGKPKPDPGMLPHKEMDEYYLDEAMVQETSTPHSWSNCDATSYRVRQGPDYPTNRQKGHSGKAIYSVFAVDTFHCPNKIPNIAEWVNVPQLDNSGLPVPPIIVVNFMVPWYAPTDGLLWGKKTTDGNGYQLVVYAAITDWAAEAYRSGNLTPSLRLLQRFIEASQQPNWEEHDLRKRFKVIAKFMNIPNISFSMMQRPLVKTYNAKPFIARDSSTMYTKEGHYFQVDVDIHAGFGILARKQLWGIRELIPQMIFDFGFVIEGTPDEELPEQMLCCARVSRIQLDEAGTNVKEFPYKTPVVKAK